MRSVLIAFFVATTTFAAIPIPQRGTWTDTGPAAGPSTRPNLIKLPDGRILTIGSFPPTGNTAIEVFDPSTNTFTQLAQDHWRRTYTASVLLQDGRVLITGGNLDQQGFLAATACTIFDPATNSVTDTGAFVVSQRGNHRLTLLPSGLILASGGWANQQSVGTGARLLEIYNPVTGTWTYAGGIAFERAGHTAVLLPDGRVAMIGGTIHTRDIEAFDLSMGAATPVAQMAAARSEPAVVRLLDGRYLIAGGGPGEIEVFDPVTFSIAVIGRLVNGHNRAAGALLPDGRVLIGSSASSSDPATPEIIDPATGRSVTVRRMHEVRNAPNAITLNDGRVLFAGGTSSPAAETFDHTVPGWVRGDFELSLRADIWWHDPVARLNKLWAFNGVTAASRDMPLPPAGMELIGVGDFDGNKLSDVVWRHTSDTVVFWPFLPGDVRGTPGFTHIRASDFRLLFTADADGDGVDDLVWRSQSTGSVDIDFVRRAMAVGVATYGQPVGPGWDLQAADDLDGDMRADLVWRNLITGENKVWFLNGGTVRQEIDIVPIVDQSYQIRGTGDFNGDTLADLVWRNDSTGHTVIWLMNGGSPNGAYIQQLPNANWRLGAIADFDGDGKSDIFWRNPTTGENMVWLMDTFAIKASSSLPPVTNANWRAFGP